MSIAGEKRSGGLFANLKIQTKLSLAYGVVLAMFTLTCLLVFVNYQDLSEARSWVSHTNSVIQRLDELRAAEQQQQIDVGGFYDTHRQSYIADYEVARQTLDRDYQDLKQLTSDNPSQQQRLNRIIALTNGWYTSSGDPVMDDDKAGSARAAANEFGAEQLSEVSRLLEMATQEELGLLGTRRDTLNNQANRLETLVSSMLVVGLTIGIATLLFTRRQISDPVMRLTRQMDRLSSGDTSIEVAYTGQGDEIGALARGLELFRSVKHAADREGRLRENLLDMNTVLGTAETVEEFAQDLLSSLCHLFNAGYGAFFAWDEATQEMSLRAGFGYEGQAGLRRNFRAGEGLVGQVIREGKPIMLGPVPEGYLLVHSALGQSLPSVLLCHPLSGRSLLGVVELALFGALDTEQEHQLEELLRNASLRFETLINATKTQALLLQSQAQTEELQASEEEMRATNDALQDRNRQLEEQRARLQESEAALTAQAEELRATNEELEETGRILNEANAQLQQTREALEQKAVELARASQYKSEFLANMSHELRTPLNSVLILAKNLADNDERNLDAEQIESARVIHDSGSHLLQLINDILDLSKIEAGKMSVLVEDAAIGDIVGTMERRFRPVARQRELALQVDTAADLPPTLRTDSPKVQQILTNLLSNAFKFTEKGRVSLRLRRPEKLPAAISGLAAASAVVFEVEDSGIGIPREKLERIFAPFEQADASTSRKYGGTGLGLAISRRMANLLGGELEVSSVPGQGSVFRLYLPEHFEAPLAEAASASATASTAPAEPIAPPSPQPAAPPVAVNGADPSILVIEDDATFAGVLAGMVQKRGFRPLVAHDAANGLALARQLPMAILLDIHLPDMDGWSVLQRLKADATTRHIPVHIVSGADESARGFQLGAVGYLVKPVSKESINQALDQLQHATVREARRVLVAGGDEALRKSVREQLAAKDAKMEACATGDEALQRLGKDGCDLLVLGFHLPDMDAFDFLDRAARLRPLPPVVVYTERELSQDEVMRLRAHTDSIVVRGARSEERLLDEVSLFLHSIGSAAGRSAALQTQTEAADLAGRTVLVVDDDMRNIFALSKVLRARGLNVLMAQDGPKALAQLEQREGRVDAVLMDVMMPGMDGHEVTRRIRGRAGWERIPIISVTAKAMPGDREKSLDAGANDYLSKPIDIDKLLSLLRIWMPQTPA